MLSNKTKQKLFLFPLKIVIIQHSLPQPPTRELRTCRIRRIKWKTKYDDSKVQERLYFILNQTVSGRNRSKLIRFEEISRKKYSHAQQGLYQKR